MFVCKSISLANYLIQNKATIIKIDKDQKSKEFLVFLFKKDDILKHVLNNWNKKISVCCEKELRYCGKTKNTCGICKRGKE